MSPTLACRISCARRPATRAVRMMIASSRVATQRRSRHEPGTQIAQSPSLVDDPDAIAEVWEMGLKAEAFAEPFSQSELVCGGRRDHAHGLRGPPGRQRLHPARHALPAGDDADR